MKKYIYQCRYTGHDESGRTKFVGFGEVTLLAPITDDSMLDAICQDIEEKTGLYKAIIRQCILVRIEE